MKAKKSSGTPAARRATKDLPPKKTREVKGGYFSIGIAAMINAERARQQYVSGGSSPSNPPSTNPPPGF
jgi:hypothetical protein